MVLRHQLSVLRRQLPRPRLEPADRALLAASAASCPEPAGPASWSSRRRCCAGTAAWSQAPGPTQLVAQDDPARPGHPAADRPPRQGASPLGLPTRPRRTAAPGVRVSASAIRATLRRHDWIQRTADGHHLAGVPAPAGRRDPRVRPASPSTPSGCGGCTCCSCIALDTRRVHLAGVTATPTVCGSPSRPATCCWCSANEDDTCAWCYATATRSSPAASTTCSAPRAPRCSSRRCRRQRQRPRARGALDPDGAGRVPGLAADPRTRPPRTGAAGVRRALSAPRGATTTGRG
jgi:hypothetical protein